MNEYSNIYHQYNETHIFEVISISTDEKTNWRPTFT